MGDIPVIQIIGLLLFVILAAGLFAIQFDRLARYRWAIFLGCLSCFSGIALIGWLTYSPSSRGPLAIYEEVRHAGAGSSFFGGGRSGSGSKHGSGANGDEAPGGTKRAGASGSGGDGAIGKSSRDGASHAQRLRASGSFSDCAKCPVMIMIPAGEIDISSGGDNPDQTRVRIARDFAVSQHEIKVDEFMVFAHETGFVASGRCNTDGIGGKSADFRKPGLYQTRHHPVVCVNIRDAQQYVAWLSARAHVPYQLLSEGRWEYARRGLVTPVAPKADDWNPEIPEGGNVKWDGWAATTTPGGRYAPNRFGVFDMMGNAAEWTADCWHDDLRGIPANGRARISSGTCSAHAVRGGSWDDKPEHTRPESRRKMAGSSRDWRTGFRVMRSVTDDVVASQ